MGFLNEGLSESCMNRMMIKSVKIGMRMRIILIIPLMIMIIY